jgi:NtrC-family two-component system sensor histidine kinase KinB
MTARPSLRSRIRNGTLVMLAIATAFGTLALPGVYRLGGAIRETLYRNYVSIDAAKHMHDALYALALAQRDGTLPQALAPNRDLFLRWIDVEQHDITEVGEAELANEIERDGRRLLAELAADPNTRRDAEFVTLHALLDKLIEINRAAMFRADSRAALMGRRLSYEFTAGLALLLIFGAALSWTLARTLSKPLDELADRLRSFSLRGGPAQRLGAQPLEELQAVVNEFNRMAERLEQFEKLNVDRLIYEKNKTEAIVDRLEDGIVLIDPKGTVTHINEIAALIVGVEKEDALGSPFDDLNSSHPHYLRVRAALRAAQTEGASTDRIEVNLHVRGRDHIYLLKPMRLRQGEGQSFGTILIMQDITYLRDKDRARANLVATLSHELKTPLTSLVLSVELLERSKDRLEPRQRELVDAIHEDVLRMRNLADDLLNLARGDAGAITIQRVPLDLAELAEAVSRRFTIQAEQKRVELKAETRARGLQVRGDPVKLSWVMSNLLGNALRYTPSGGKIEVTAGRGSGGSVQLKVSDTGPGLPPEIRNRLFERFAQWNVNGLEAGSAGLGLAIVKDIVEAHGGRIFVNTSDRGSEFTVELPPEQV